MNHITVVIEYAEGQEMPAFTADMELLGGHVTAVQFNDALAEIERLEAEPKVKCATHGARTFGLCSACQKVEREEIVRSYTHQLGEMARLSDVVCSGVLAFQESEQFRQLFSESEIAAAREIMEYVDAVRPGDGVKNIEWAMHILGPDDVIPCVGEFDALRKANQHNKSFAKLMTNDPSPNDPYCVAVAELV